MADEKTEATPPAAPTAAVVANPPATSEAKVADKKPEASSPGTGVDSEGRTGAEKALNAAANTVSRAEVDNTELKNAISPAHKLVESLRRPIDPNFDADESRVEQGRRRQAARAEQFREEARATAKQTGVKVD